MYKTVDLCKKADRLKYALYIGVYTAHSVKIMLLIHRLLMNMKVE